MFSEIKVSELHQEFVIILVFGGAKYSTTDSCKSRRYPFVRHVIHL